MLDERRGVSYPDGQQTPDGLIRIIYDYDRRGDRHILMATFRPEDVAAGKDTSGDVRLRQLVSEASGGKAKEESKAKAKHNTSRPEPLLKKTEVFPPGFNGAVRYRIPGIVVTPKGTVLCLYEAGESITCARFNLDWIHQP